MDRTRDSACTITTTIGPPGVRRCGLISVTGHATVMLTLVVITWIGLRHIPPGVCFGDGGGLQLASATLGIAHPPGYPLLASIGYLISCTRLADPAYTINVVCCLSGVGVLWLLIRFQIHWGASTLPACVVALAVAQHPRFWINLTSPEVYMPTLALLAMGIWCLSRYTRGGARRSLWGGVVLLGMAAVTRPPLLAVLPFAAVAIWMAGDTRRSISRRTSNAILVTLAGLAIPATYAAGYLWSRDNARNPFNYIQLYDTEYDTLPDADGGLRAQAQRIWWLASAQQYRYLLKVSASRMRGRLRWLGRRLFPDRTWPMWPVLLLALVGGITALRRHPRTAVLMLGVVMGSAAFILVYRVADDAADVLPILYAGAACSGVAVSLVFHDRTGPLRTWGVRTAFIAMLIVVPGRVNALPKGSRLVDARAFLAGADLPALPSGSIILSGWQTFTPLLYAQAVWGQASQVTFIHASPGRWGKFVTAYEGHPIYLTNWRDRWPAYTPQQQGSLWHLAKK